MGKRRGLREVNGFGAAAHGPVKIIDSRETKPTIVVDSEDAVLQALGNRKLAKTIESNTDIPTPSDPPERPVISKKDGSDESPTTAEEKQGDGTVSLTKEQVTAIAQAAIANTLKEEAKKQAAANEKHQADLAEKDAAIENFRAELEAAHAATAEAEKKVDTLSSVFKLTGTPDPVQSEGGSVATKKSLEVLGEGSQEMRGWEKHLKLAEQQGVWTNTKSGGRMRAADYRSSDAYFRQNRDKIRAGVEAVLKSHGMFGSEPDPDKNAITVESDIPSINFTYLSAAMRNTHFEDLIHWQFAHTGLELGRRPGLEIAVPRVPFRARPTSLADRTLTPGTPLVTTADPINELNALIRLEELGLGKDASNQPIGFSDFIEAYSMMSLEMQIENILMYDYAFTKDLALRAQWFRAADIVYNKAGTIASAPGDVNTGDGGTMSEDFLTMLRAYMKSRQIPTYRDGCYGISMNPTDLANYMKDKGTKERDFALEKVDLVTRMLQASVQADFGGEIAGYRGTYNGFHIFEQNVYGVGAAGVDPGVNDLVAGDTNTYDFLTSFAFGRDTIAWCTGLPAEIRMSSNKDFERQMIMTWISHENAGSLDVVAEADGGATGEQGRVVQTRCLARAI